MFESIRVKDFFLNEDEQTKKTHQELEDYLKPILNSLSESDSQNIPVFVMETFIALLLGKELIYSKTRDVPKGTSPINKDHFQKNAQKMVKALSHFYRDNEKGFSSEDEKNLLNMFEINKDDFHAIIQKSQGQKNRLFKAFHITGKTEQDKEMTLCRQGGLDHKLLKELNDELEHIKKEINTIFKYHQAFRRTCIMDLLIKTEFFDCLIDKKNQSFINFLTDFFKDNIGDFYFFIERNNSYLSKTNTKYTDSPKGFVHIFENTAFSEALREKIPTSEWDQKLFLSLGSNTLYKGSHISVAENFIKKIEELPPDKLKKMSKPFFQMIKRIFLALDRSSSSYDLKNVQAFLTKPKTETLQQMSLYFFNQLSDEQFLQVVPDLKENDIQSVCHLFMRSLKSRKRLLNLTLANGKNLAWTGFEKGFLKSEDMDILITEAISQDNTKFLFEPKDLYLTPDFPGYKKLQNYFKDKTHAIRFVNTFQTSVKTEETRFSQLKDFITQPQMILKIASLYSIVHYYAKENADEKLLGFFFDGDIKNKQNLTLKMPLEQAKVLLLKQNGEGKTPWHYLCQKRNRLFFGKNFKTLHPLFLQSCHIKDNEGKTPLDYIRDDLKFRKVLVEKIPAVEKLMTEAGLSLTYTPKQKEVKEEIKIAPKPEILPQKTEEKKQVWEIQEMGHDKLRKDNEFNELLRQEIDMLPPPNCGSVNVANRRLQKKEVFDAPVFKIWYENKRWRVPFIKDDETKTLFIFPASDRNDTYTNQDYCRIVRNRVKWLKRHIDHIKS